MRFDIYRKNLNTNDYCISVFPTLEEAENFVLSRKPKNVDYYIVVNFNA